MMPCLGFPTIREVSRRRPFGRVCQFLLAPWIAVLWLGKTQRVTVGISEPRYPGTSWSGPNAQFVLDHIGIPLKLDALLCQRRDCILYVRDFPSQRSVR